MTLVHSELGDSTRCVHAGLPASVVGEPFLPGPSLASVYVMDPEAGPRPGVDAYGRPDNPTRRRLEAAIGELEGGDCLAFATGMAAVTALLLTLVGPDQTVLLPADGYYGTRAWAAQALTPLGVRVVPVPTVGPYPDFTGVRLVLLETPANPGLDVCDIAALAEAAHAAGALVAVDNTTATPLGQRPLDLGADLVVASGTKALSGHGDVLLGYVATRDAELLQAARLAQRDRCHPGRLRRLAGPPVAGHPRPAAGPAGGQRRRDRRRPGRAPGRADRPLAGSGHRPGRRPGQAADAPDAGRGDLHAGRGGRGGPVPDRLDTGDRGDLVRRPAHHGRPPGPVGR